MNFDELEKKLQLQTVKILNTYGVKTSPERVERLISLFRDSVEAHTYEGDRIWGLEACRASANELVSSSVIDLSDRFPLQAEGICIDGVISRIDKIGGLAKFDSLILILSEVESFFTSFERERIFAGSAATIRDIIISNAETLISHGYVDGESRWPNIVNLYPQPFSAAIRRPDSGVLRSVLNLKIQLVSILSKWAEERFESDIQAQVIEEFENFKISKSLIAALIKTEKEEYFQRRIKGEAIRSSGGLIEFLSAISQLINHSQIAGLVHELSPLFNKFTFEELIWMTSDIQLETIQNTQMSIFILTRPGKSRWDKFLIDTMGFLPEYVPSGHTVKVGEAYEFGFWKISGNFRLVFYNGQPFDRLNGTQAAILERLYQNNLDGCDGITEDELLRSVNERRMDIGLNPLKQGRFRDHFKSGGKVKRIWNTLIRSSREEFPSGRESVLKIDFSDVPGF